MVWKYLWSSSTTQEVTQSKDGDTVVATETVLKETLERDESLVAASEDLKSFTAMVVPAESQPPPVRKRRISIRQAISLSRNVSSQPKPASSTPLAPEQPKDRTSVEVTPVTGDISAATPKPPVRVRRFSIQAISSPRSKGPPALPKEIPASAPHEAAMQEAPLNPQKHHVSRADRRAQKSAQRLQILITGETSVASPLVSPITAKDRVDKIKSQLSNPTSGNRVIAELRKLPIVGRGDRNCEAPIHAVCLEHPDAEEDALHFSKLHTVAVDVQAQDTTPTSPVDKMAAVLKDMRVIDLVSAPDLGLGQPGDGKGLLAGAVPTAETVLNGVKQITPQLMALGYATGQMITPDHRSIYPPTDRISVLTYWWGMELLLPPPTLHYLETVQSITGSIVNFLSAMALVNNGVREILPLVRYIAQFVDLEYKSIKAQDKGKGVVCAATWLMPAALVPRSWDFPDPPAEADPAALGLKSRSSLTRDGTDEKKVDKPRPISSMLDIVTPPPASEATKPISIQG
ncbi:hypothetical protein BKA70DRAFT_1259604 [Coprinopsis sp. MPI-PUGE-AT-0042]|nr:hypothetical protein BKA70DRAFT_1259604 [Coprinopsis sp. MPI-PUGE-AT-0042]